MSDWLLLFLIATAVCLVCVIAWLRRLVVEFGWLQGNYIELHGKVVVAETIIEQQARELEDLRSKNDEELRKAVARVTTQAEYTMRGTEDRARIVMYQLSAQQALLPPDKRAKAIYEE